MRGAPLLKNMYQGQYMSHLVPNKGLRFVREDRKYLRALKRWCVGKSYKSVNKLTTALSKKSKLVPFKYLYLDSSSDFYCLARTSSLIWFYLDIKYIYI